MIITITIIITIFVIKIIIFTIITIWLAQVTRTVLLKGVSTFILLQRFDSAVTLAPCARCVCNSVCLFAC